MSTKKTTKNQVKLNLNGTRKNKLRLFSYAIYFIVALMPALSCNDISQQTVQNLNTTCSLFEQYLVQGFYFTRTRKLVPKDSRGRGLLKKKNVG